MSRATTEKPEQTTQQQPARQSQENAPPSYQMTKRQSACIYRQLRERGLNPEETEVWLCQAANIDSSTELTKRQASTLIECLFRVTDPVPIRPESGVQHD